MYLDHLLTDSLENASHLTAPQSIQLRANTRQPSEQLLSGGFLSKRTKIMGAWLPYPHGVRVAKGVSSATGPLMDLAL